MGDLTFRCLRGNDEVDAWLDFLAECFRAKGTPRSYFERHLRCDPHCRLDGIQVALCEGGAEGGSQRIVGSVRVFVREVLTSNGARLPMGGIGEVATLTEFRGRGAASRLLGMAVDFMRREMLESAPGSGSSTSGGSAPHHRMLSSLHCGAALVPMYSRAGWHPVPYSYTHVRLPVWMFASSSSLPPTPPLISDRFRSHIKVQTPPYPHPDAMSPDLVAAVSDLHTAFYGGSDGNVAQRTGRCGGIVCRGWEYWNTWWQAEVRHRNMTLATVTAVDGGAGFVLDGYIVARPQPSSGDNVKLSLLVADAALKPELAPADQGDVLLSLIAAMLEQHLADEVTGEGIAGTDGHLSSAAGGDGYTVEVVLPAALGGLTSHSRALSSWSEKGQMIHVDQVSDPGFCYRWIHADSSLDDDDDSTLADHSEETVRSISEALFGPDGSGQHCFLKIDGF